MPRKSKVENLSELPDSEGRTAVIEDIKSEPVEDKAPEPVVESVAEPVVESIAEPKAKPKAKAKAKAKVKKAVEPVEEKAPEPEPDDLITLADDAEVEHIELHPAVVAADDSKTKKKDDKVACPDCGRMVSAKTLKYTHKANCKALKPKPEPVHSAVVYQKEEEPAPVKAPEPTLIEQYEESIEDRMKKLRAQRMQKKQERISSLAAQAF